MLVVLDYGMGNLKSVVRALEHVGAQPTIQHDLRGATKVVLPGVGAFAAAMERLKTVQGDLRAFVETDQPLLGICLGQQLLFEASDEHGGAGGLGFLGGHVRYLPVSPSIKVPHVGWNELNPRQTTGLGATTLRGDQVYFVHSLYCDPTDSEVVAATSHHGIEFAASVQRRNLWGTQFHPEKSGEVGLRMIKAFVEC
ncbi:MAG: imidazole glycerol phosphate synthase subunit HisH [Chthonomonas sp.]|nr:imidazole glycerol phosphate synthase subunit HisH [Chthonomonas sp.]